MKHLIKVPFVALLLATSAISANAQISRLTGGTIIANSPNTNPNVGINTTNPADVLHIVSPTAAMRLQRLNSPASNQDNTLRIGIGSNIFPMALPPGTINFTATGINPGSTPDMAFSANGLSPQFIVKNNGNVGVGVTTTSAILHVGAATNPNIKLTAGAANLEIGIATSAGSYSPNAQPGDIVMRPSGTPPTSQFIFNTNSLANTGRRFLFACDGDKMMEIADNGTVKIGNVTTPNTNNYRLYVERGILTEKVKVALKTSTDWADYVFAPNYHLKSLAEVEAFVKENKHLPNVPSADELVKNGGIDVNEMFAKQMEKIEELTLYLIEMKKEINDLKKENSEIKSSSSPSKN